jgi:hypothetical protein
VSFTDWFRSKRALIADRDRYRALAIKQTAEIAAVTADRDMWAQRCTDAHLSAEKVINQQEEQLAEYDRALTALRASFNRSRLHNRPMPWQDHDAIQQDAEAKRREDDL